MSEPRPSRLLWFVLGLVAGSFGCSTHPAPASTYLHLDAAEVASAEPVLREAQPRPARAYRSNRFFRHKAKPRRKATRRASYRLQRPAAKSANRGAFNPVPFHVKQTGNMAPVPDSPLPRNTFDVRLPFVWHPTPADRIAGGHAAPFRSILERPSFPILDHSGPAPADDLGPVRAYVAIVAAIFAAATAAILIACYRQAPARPPAPPQPRTAVILQLRNNRKRIA